VGSKKDKLIEEAQRLLLRGQLDKAIKAYEQLLLLDPSAINQRQKLAELLVKAGRTEDARSELEAIGKHYSSNGFYLKAIAVFKQLQKLFPADISITLTLAGLNEKHGLVGNALAEYKQVYDWHERASNMEEALKTLDRMQNVDPQNVNIKLKLAESYFQVGRKDESYAAFVRLASLLQERGDGAALSRLNARIQQLFPEKTAFMLEVLAEQVEEGNAASAVAGIQALLRTDPNDRRIWDLIVAAYRKLDQPQRIRVAYQHYLKFFPDELAPKKGLLECLAFDKDIKGSLALLERYEQDFIQAGAAADLAGIYKRLDEIDPVNVRVLEGLKRAYEAVDDQGSVEALESRLASFKALAGKPAMDDQPASSRIQHVGSDQLFAEEKDSPDGPEHAPVDVPDSESAGTMEAVEPVLEPEGGSASFEQTGLVVTDSPYRPFDDDIEIEIEVDDDIGFECAEASNEPAGVSGDSLPESVCEFFGIIETTPRAVKFGSDMDTSDAQSHYDLGIAFKEMGLFDEAIHEFRQAAAEPARKLECGVLQGACLRAKGDAAAAENVLRSLLEPGLGLENSCSVKYELALTFDALGRDDESAALLAEIDADNPGFRDVRSRLDAAGVDGALDFSDEDLKGFELK